MNGKKLPTHDGRARVALTLTLEQKLDLIDRIRAERERLKEHARTNVALSRDPLCSGWGAVASGDLPEGFEVRAMIPEADAFVLSLLDEGSQ